MCRHQDWDDCNSECCYLFLSLLGGISISWFLLPSLELVVAAYCLVGSTSESLAGVAIGSPEWTCFYEWEMFGNNGDRLEGWSLRGSTGWRKGGFSVKCQGGREGIQVSVGGLLQSCT